jgi:hypothetical protein
MRSGEDSHVVFIFRSDYYLCHVCLSVRPHGTDGLLLNGFLWNLVFQYFSKISRESSVFIKNPIRLMRTLHEDLSKFMIVPRWILLRMRNVSDKFSRENQNTSFRSQQNPTSYLTSSYDIHNPLTSRTIQRTGLLARLNHNSHRSKHQTPTTTAPRSITWTVCDFIVLYSLSGTKNFQLYTPDTSHHRTTQQ